MASHFQRFLFLLLTFHMTQSITSMLDIYPELSLVEDINYDILMNNVSPALKTVYLSKFQGKIDTQYEGVVFGQGKRVLVNLPVCFEHKSCRTSINVIFKVDTGVPHTTLAKQVLQKLYENCPKMKKIFFASYLVRIADKKIKVQQSQETHFESVNILGADFLTLTNSRIEVNYFESQPPSIIGNLKLRFQASIQYRKAEEYD